MTASLFVTGTHALGVGRGDDARTPDGVAHAVPKPVVDGLDASVCGLLVTAVAAQDWPTSRLAPRCEECARIAGQ
jgi:hypothetical protein